MTEQEKKKFIKEQKQSLGWKIEAIYQSAYDNANHDYAVSHPEYLPQGIVFMNTSKKKVVEWLNSKLTTKN